MFLVDYLIVVFNLCKKWLMFRPPNTQSVLRSCAVIAIVLLSAGGFVSVASGVSVFGASSVDYLSLCLAIVLSIADLLMLADINAAKKWRRERGDSLEVRDVIGLNTLVALVLGVLLIALSAKVFLTSFLGHVVYAAHSLEALIGNLVGIVLPGVLGLFIILRMITYRLADETLNPITISSHKHMRALGFLAVVMNIPLLGYMIARGVAGTTLSPFEIQLLQALGIAFAFLVVMGLFSEALERRKRKRRAKKYDKDQLGASLREHLKEADKAFFESTRKQAAQRAFQESEILSDIRKQEDEDRWAMERAMRKGEREERRAAFKEFKKTDEYKEMLEQSAHDIYYDDPFLGLVEIR